MLGKCNKCPKWFENIKKEIDLGKPSDTMWYQWVRVEQAVKIKNGKRKGKTKRIIKKLKKICKEATMEEAIKSPEDQIPYFLRHVYVKRQQSYFFGDKRGNLTIHEVIVQIDFAENYPCKYHNEVQSTHWNQQQVTVFTVAIWTNNGVKNTWESHVIVTHELVHDKKAVAVLMSGTVKRMVWNAVSIRKAITVTDANSFCLEKSFRGKKVPHVRTT